MDLKGHMKGYKVLQLLISLTLAMILLTGTALAEEEEYQLTIVVHKGGTAQENVEVQLGEKTAETDANGEVVFEGLTTGEYDYQVTKNEDIETSGSKLVVEDSLELVALSEEEPEYQLDMWSFGYGDVKVDGVDIYSGWQEAYTEGEELTLTADPEEAWDFSGWYIEGEMVEKDEVVITMDEDKSIGAIFDRETTRFDSRNSRVAEYDGEIRQAPEGSREGAEVTLELSGHRDELQPGDKVKMYVQSSRDSEYIFLERSFGEDGERLPQFFQAEKNYAGTDNVWRIIGEVGEQGQMSFYVDSEQEGEIELQIGNSFDGVEPVEIVGEAKVQVLGSEEEIKQEEEEEEEAKQAGEKENEQQEEDKSDSDRGSESEIDSDEDSSDDSDDSNEDSDHGVEGSSSHYHEFLIPEWRILTHQYR